MKIQIFVISFHGFQSLEAQDHKTAGPQDSYLRKFWDFYVFFIICVNYIVCLFSLKEYMNIELHFLRFQSLDEIQHLLFFCV